MDLKHLPFEVGTDRGEWSGSIGVGTAELKTVLNSDPIPWRPLAHVK
jgi:hypothetical protein